MVSCDFPNKNRRHQEEERPCGIYPYGVELPANHPVLLETFLYNLAEVEHCWFFFNGHQSETHRSGPIDVCRYTGRGNKQCMLPFQSENCSIHLFSRDGRGETYLHGLPSHQTEATPTYMSIHNRFVVIVFHVTLG